MSPHAQLVLVLGITCLVAIGSAAFTGWAVWSLFWNIYDYFMQRHKRIRNNQFDGARRANQFHIATCYRDMKGIHR